MNKTMNIDPNPKVRISQAILVILLLFLIICIFIDFRAVILIGIGMFVWNKRINRIKKEDGYNEKRKEMGRI